MTQSQTVTSDQAFAKSLGERLRQMRHLRGMTLNALAEAAVCSESLLSKFENGKNCPSLPMLGRIVQALDVPMAALLDGERGRALVIRRCKLPSDGLSLGICVDVESVVVDHGRSTVRRGILSIAPGQTSSLEAHEAGDETGIVLEGRPNLIVDGRSHALDIGDAFAFKADQVHGYENGGSTQVRIFRVYAPSAVAA